MPNLLTNCKFYRPPVLHQQCGQHSSDLSPQSLMTEIFYTHLLTHSNPYHQIKIWNMQFRTSRQLAQQQALLMLLYLHLSPPSTNRSIQRMKNQWMALIPERPCIRISYSSSSPRAEQQEDVPGITSLSLLLPLCIFHSASETQPGCLNKSEETVMEQVEYL